MSESPLTPTVTVKVGGQNRSFRWGNVPIYRLSCLSMKPKGDYATVIAMLWASLVPMDAVDFPTPEAFAEKVNPDEAAALYDEVITKIRPEKSPNVSGSKMKRSPSSS